MPKRGEGFPHLKSVATFKLGRYRFEMNWSSNGFLGVYAELLENRPEKPESKCETLRQLREQRFSERQARAEGRRAMSEGNNQLQSPSDPAESV